jgi:transposase InsO family protein
VEDVALLTTISTVSRVASSSAGTRGLPYVWWLAANTVEAVPGLNRVWIGDITYVTTLEGWWPLAVVVYLRSRRVIGGAMRQTLEGAITRDALTMALEDRRPGAGCLSHSDRGSQYATLKPCWRRTPWFPVRVGRAIAGTMRLQNASSRP